MYLNRPRSSSQDFHIKYLEYEDRYMLDSKEVRQETNNGLSIGTMYFDPG